VMVDIDHFKSLVPASRPSHSGFLGCRLWCRPLVKWPVDHQRHIRPYDRRRRARPCGQTHRQFSEDLGSGRALRWRGVLYPLARLR
jgi:hypothetical protein